MVTEWLLTFLGFLCKAGFLRLGLFAGVYATVSDSEFLFIECFGWDDQDEMIVFIDHMGSTQIDGVVGLSHFPLFPGGTYRRRRIVAISIAQYFIDKGDHTALYKISQT